MTATPPGPADLARQPSLAEACAGAAGRGVELTALSRRALAVLGREWLLHGHLQDRAGMPLYLARAGREEMERLAIEEWMLASPVYSRRMQRALAFGGDGVSTIFKNLQLDIGAPHQFMDFRFLLHDDRHGEFWLDHCGALMDVEPMGEDFVRGMCHTIEDPTFDATAGATNPRARVRPVHRPPRHPVDRHPHCRWTVTVQPDAEPLRPHPRVGEMESSVVGQVPVDVPSARPEQGGVPDYSGPFRPDLVLEDLSFQALVVVLQEFAVQSHLLARAYLSALERRVGVQDAVRIGGRVLVGLAGVTAERLVAAAALPPGRAESMAAVLGLHPVFHPRSYVDLRVDVAGEDRVRFAFGACPAAGDAEPYSWLACIDAGGVEALDAIVRAVDPRARCRPVTPAAGEWRAYEAVIQPRGPASAEPEEMLLVKVSTGAGFRFRAPDLSNR